MSARQRATVATLDRYGFHASARVAEEEFARMRNALEILADIRPTLGGGYLTDLRFVRAVAREGLGREPLPKQED